MPIFSKASLTKIATLDPRLQRILRSAIKVGPDFTVLVGHRNKADQNHAFEHGFSKLEWPNSKHNASPSKAVDLAPWPIDWKNINRFRMLAGFLIGYAEGQGVTLRWGGDWDRDWRETDEKGLRDFCHFEIVDG